MLNNNLLAVVCRVVAFGCALFPTLYCIFTSLFILLHLIRFNTHLFFFCICRVCSSLASRCVSLHFAAKHTHTHIYNCIVFLVMKHFAAAAEEYMRRQCTLTFIVVLSLTTRWHPHLNTFPLQNNTFFFQLHQIVWPKVLQGGPHQIHQTIVGFDWDSQFGAVTIESILLRSVAIITVSYEQFFFNWIYNWN